MTMHVKAIWKPMTNFKMGVGALIPRLGKQNKEDLCESKTSLVYTASSQPAMSIFKENKKIKNGGMYVPGSGGARL
ncbi:hypothetical protein I79_017880 [Cricetulus griseus]|uniref:Uncharacterized protein n=1 Tax=Cricetulus griseus TaxID=10029 RepID=G3I379_CRIGR|nr:hypothetical protein I79_017880 [Cricetulus griseus]